MFLTFANSVLLVGLAGVVVPLVLHLLSRARYQSVVWGAMMFLEGFEARHRHSTQLNQIALLMARMGLVALLAAVLAQPVLQQWSPEAEARSAAMRAADHGRVLCLAGGAVCGSMAIGLIGLALFGIGRGASRFRQIVLCAAAVVGVLGAAEFGQRAFAWQREVRRLAAEQPTGTPSGSDSALRARIDAAILLDCSPSMNFEENGHTRFGLAQAAAKQVLSGLHRGDRVCLLLMGQPQSDAELEPTSDLQAISDRIDAAHTGYAPADVAQSLRRADEALDRDGRTARDLYVVTDRQAISWRGANDYFLTHQWPEVLKRSGAATRVFAVPIGNTDADNVAVAHIELANPPAILGQPAELQIDLHNYGPTPRAALPLTVTVNGRTAFDSVVSVSANRIARIAVPVKPNFFSAAGSQVIAAEIKTTGYRDDDRLESVVEAIEPIRVLVISGDEWGEGAGDFRSEADFLRLALTPLQSLHRKGPDPCTLEVVSDEDWSKIDLKKYQVVILANVERFSAAQARSLEQYVYGGGGLLVAPGNLSRISSYNDELWRDGAGILPAELEDATSADGAEATTIVGFDPTTPVLQFLHDRPDLMLSSTIGRYYPVNPRPSDAQVLAWYTSGSAFLIESHAGAGKVLLMTTSLDADWSTLPLSNFYLPFVQSAVRDLASGKVPSRNLPLGESLHLTVDGTVDERATVELPDGDRRPVTVSRFGGISELRFNETQLPGIYRLRYKDAGGERTVAFSVHPPQDESDLSQLTDRRWAELESGLHLKRIDPNERSVAVVVAGARDGYELWPWGIGGLMLGLVFELTLARHWSAGAY